MTAPQPSNRAQQLQEEESSQQPGQPPFSWQLLVGMCAISVVICYADRSNISTAILPMAESFGWDKVRLSIRTRPPTVVGDILTQCPPTPPHLLQAFQGVVLSSFFLGYALTQMLGGQLADRYGGKLILGAGVAVWSLFTAAIPPAAAAGTSTLLATRVLLGVGEGVAFPAIHSLIARYTRLLLLRQWG